MGLLKSKRNGVVFYWLIFIIVFFELSTISMCAKRSKGGGKGRTVTLMSEEDKCKDTSYCHREHCKDRRAYAPVKCHGHYEEMECLRRCRDPEGLLHCFANRGLNGTEEHCMLEYKREILQGPQLNNFTSHLGVPCGLKCLADPKFWGCVHRCDRKGCFKTFKKCEEEGPNPRCTKKKKPTDYSKYWSLRDCKACYISGLIEEIPMHSDCIFSYQGELTGLEADPTVVFTLQPQPNRCIFPEGAEGSSEEETDIGTDIEACVEKFIRKEDAGYKDAGIIEECFRIKFMKRQLELCQGGSFDPECVDVNSEACHKSCVRLLTKPFCHIPCPRNEELKRCASNCINKYPNLSCQCKFESDQSKMLQNPINKYFLDEDMVRINAFFGTASACPDDDVKCFSDKIHLPKSPDPIPVGPESDSWRVNATKLRNCMSNRHVLDLSGKLRSLLNDSYFIETNESIKYDIGDDLGKLASHYSYYECNEVDCKDVVESRKIQCVKNCVLKEKDYEDMNKVCDESSSENGNGTLGFFLRSEFVLWCMFNDNPEKEMTWTFEWYAAAPIDDPAAYEKLLKCEKSIRKPTPETKIKLGLDVFLNFANATYQLEAAWCTSCIESQANKTFHPQDLDTAKCELNECFRKAADKACPPLSSTRNFIQTITSTQCSWTIDYSLSRNPFKIWRAYFDEIPPHDETSSLQEPNSEKYLIQSNITSTAGHYVFPYFIILRGTCEDGYYDDNVYKFIASGATPVVKVSFIPVTSRQKYVGLLVTTFQSALINLERVGVEENLYIPQNPMNRINETTGEYDGKTGCHLNMCYPAFVVPQQLIHIPSFAITVVNQQSFSSLSTFGFTSTLHARDVSGVGSLKIADRRDPPTGSYFFPARKTEVYQDTQLADIWGLLPDSGYGFAEDFGLSKNQTAPGPELSHITDVDCKLYKTTPHTFGGNEHLPLDSEDFMRIQYTHGNAPQVVIAGFHDPNLVIIGDPNLETFQLARWNFESSSGTPENPTARLFHNRYKCLISQFKVGGFPKPMYAMPDRYDENYWLQYYRLRYAIKNYEDASEAKAIFDAITLEDRILFVTTGGIVSLYQNNNITSSMGKAWEVEGGDSLERCFKIFRAARRTHPQGDTIVGITYDYQVWDKNEDVFKDINQQIWVGRYVEPGVPIKWKEIITGTASENLKEERIFNIGGDKLGSAENLPDQQIMEIPVERREINPKSQVEAICYKAYRSNMGKAVETELVESEGWCAAVDATPVTAESDVIQVLVRMSAKYKGDAANSDNSDDTNTVYFYIIASYAFEKSLTQGTNWQIDSIIPRIPCLDEHNESIPSVVPFTIEYFRQETKNNTYRGCHQIEKNKMEENIIYLHGMTYTRSFNRHLFLYGNKLLQSTDGGQTFVHLQSFPIRETAYPHQYLCTGSSAAYHRIMLMAFDDLGHYAFLTNKRELWYGNLGSLEQKRLRPSDAHSMTSTYIPELKEITDAVPFSLFFDSKNHLNELVAVVDVNGTVIRIAKRPANERAVLRASYFLTKMSDYSGKLLYQLTKDFKNELVIPDRLLEEIQFNPVDWSVFCPYASPSFYHNFSAKHSRTQKFFFPSPRQHLKLGLANTKTTVLTFQAITFSLVWKSFFNQPNRAYSKLDNEPLQTWISKKLDAAVLGRLAFMNNDPSEHGILVSPNKYQRFKADVADSRRIYEVYHLDYGIVILLMIEFSVSNDYTFNPVDYANHHLSNIHLNVDNANGSLIQINTEKKRISSRAAIRYLVHISVRKSKALRQVKSGRNGIQVPIFFHLIGGFGNCVPLESAGILGDSIATYISVGCPPSTDLVFDWDSTLRSIKFRDMEAHYGGKPEECYNEEPFCFFVKYPLTLHFDLFDESKQNYFNFSGKFMMKVVAGGYTRDSLRTYSSVEQEAYNVPGVSDVSLIWNEWDRQSHRKVERKELHQGSNDSREIVLRSGVSSIQWACHTLSPCARITPQSSMESIYYFKLFITNRGVDEDTLCLFEKEFVILLYGFPPSTEIQLFTTIFFYALMVTLVYIAFFCLRENKKVWKTTKSKIYGWYQIAIDTIPRWWAKHDEDEVEETEADKQKRRDDIILSLQGHLNVPRLIHKVQVDTEATADNDDVDIISHRSSFSSIRSSSSGGSNALVLNPVVGRPPAATWTDLIYEQIISRRLATIIERNKQHNEDLKRKTIVETGNT